MGDNEVTYQKALENVDFIIVLSDPRNGKAVSLSKQFPQFESEEWSLKINEYIYHRLSENKIDWSDEFISDDGVYHSPFGDIHIYRNLRRYVMRANK